MDGPLEIGAVPVREAELQVHYADVVSMQAAENVRMRQQDKRNRVGNRVLALVCGAQAFGLLYMLPLVRYVPIFVYTNELGVHETATAISELPPDTRVAGIEMLLWQYVREREHYSPTEADESYKMVSAMSSLPVREQYQAWANPALNKNAYGNKLGKNGFIRLERISAEFTQHSDDWMQGRIVVRFCRVTVRQGQGAVAERMKAPLAYEMVDSVPLWERLKFNHAGLRVTEYPGIENEGNGQGKVVQLGSPNPCG